MVCESTGRHAVSALSTVSGAALVAASLLTWSGIVEAGLASARDPKYTIVSQRRRIGGE